MLRPKVKVSLRCFYIYSKMFRHRVNDFSLENISIRRVSLRRFSVKISTLEVSSERVQGRVSIGDWYLFSEVFFRGSVWNFL